MHIFVSNLTIIGSDNGLSPGRRQAIIWTNAEMLLIGPLGTNFSEILIKMHTFSFKKIHLKLSSAKWQPFCLGLNVLIHVGKRGPWTKDDPDHWFISAPPRLMWVNEMETQYQKLGFGHHCDADAMALILQVISIFNTESVLIVPIQFHISACL